MTAEEAGEIVRGIIQSYIGPDHRVIDMQTLYGVLVESLQKAHQQGWDDRTQGEASITKH